MTNETKQTAVEQLISKIPLGIRMQLAELGIDFENAKEMEKEQKGYSKADVIKAGEMGEINHHDVNHIISYLDEAKQFNETYVGNK
jgi:hypothetical protein